MMSAAKDRFADPSDGGEAIVQNVALFWRAAERDEMHGHVQ
jgi:hypothetical protein